MDKAASLSSDAPSRADQLKVGTVPWALPEVSSPAAADGSLPVLPPQGTQRRQRAWQGAAAAHADLPRLVGSLADPAAAKVGAALEALLPLVVAVYPQNQIAVSQLGGVPRLAAILSAAASRGTSSAGSPDGPSSPSADGAVAEQALCVLLCLAGHADLVEEIAAVPGCLQAITALAGGACKTKSLMSMSLRLLADLTHSSALVQQDVVVCGAHEHAIRQVVAAAAAWRQGSATAVADTVAPAKWSLLLLANLSSSPSVVEPLAGGGGGSSGNLSGPALRDGLATRSDVLPSLVALLGLPSHGAASTAMVQSAARVLANVARARSENQAALLEAGAAERLAALLDVGGPFADDSKVLAAAMSALAALAIGNLEATNLLLRHPGLLASLRAALGARRSSVFDADQDDAQVVVAAHHLIYVLGHVLLTSDTGGGVIGGARRGADQDVVLATALQAARYVTLHQAADAVGIDLPKLKATAEEGSALSLLELAELSHRTNTVCLERLRGGNVRSAVLAAGVLYHLSAAASTAAQCRQLLCNSGLIRQLQALLSGGPPPELAQAVLWLLDSLAGHEGCVKLMASEPQLLGCLDAALDHGDALVRLCAERAVCSLYVTVRATPGADA